MKNTHEELYAHYRQLLGLEKPWGVVSVKLDLEDKRVEIEVAWPAGHTVMCPECGSKCRLKDHAPERTWRHLDTMQFETRIRAQVPRSECDKHGVKTVRVPWAEPHSRWTVLFERLAVDVLRASRNWTKAAEILRLSWDEVQRLGERAVTRGLDRRKAEALPHIGMDEKNFGRGHSYITLMTDLQRHRVLDVSEDRTEASADALWEKLTPQQRQSVEAVATDMWPAYVNAARRAVPQAAVVHDKFHISKHLNEAVDKVRRQENRQMLEDGNERLKGTRWLWMTNNWNLSPTQKKDFESLKYSQLKVSRAWAMKELFPQMWLYRYEGAARNFFRDWFGWASRSRLKPMVDVAYLLKRHLENILTYLKHPITNALTEGFNSVIQQIKSDARGFRNFMHYRIRILFFCGKLDVYP